MSRSTLWCSFIVEFWDTLYNMDETGVQTSSNKPTRVLTRLGKKQVGFIASTERGRTTTAYLRTATTQNAVGGFEKTGLWPPNRYIFDDAEFLAATTMENLPCVKDSNHLVINSNNTNC
ncbi:unnamed protein product [Euphydryas editha]|uniref:Transposase n=1 Tax=Euphydryas editha TaxID=104508 RepID=A0AAU9TNR6_EUPED|nr:unnamed protein product [Euphydryas editha]